MLFFLKGGLVYANYGRREDFDFLKSRKIDVRGQIVIARYGGVFRGNIVRECFLILKITKRR